MGAVYTKRKQDRHLYHAFAKKIGIKVRACKQAHRIQAGGQKGLFPSESGLSVDSLRNERTLAKKKPNRARITSTRTAKHKEAELWMDIADNQEEDLKCLGKTELQTNCAYERWQNAQSKTRNPKQWENAQSKNVKSKRLWRLDSRKCHRIRAAFLSRERCRPAPESHHGWWLPARVLVAVAISATIP